MRQKDMNMQRKKGNASHFVHAWLLLRPYSRTRRNSNSWSVETNIGRGLTNEGEADSLVDYK